MSRLVEYLRHGAACRDDCAMWAGGWVMASTGRDPCAAWRDTYTSAAEGIEKCGGLIRTVGREMRHFGFRMTRNPQAGDLGVIRFASANGKLTVCAIKIPRGWACKATERGLSVLPGVAVRVVAAWRIV